ncbi:MAG: hypothetical protein KDB21_04045 [Acidimicrobiales bacterium]|nr:hypothetical protein [Acidimicrobiales bacterium]
MLIVAGVLTGLAVLGGAILALVGREVAKEIERQSSEADPDDYDLDITSCEIESDLVNWPTLRGNLKNTSSERQGFTIVIDVTAGGEPVAREEHLIPGLSPGQIAIVRVGLAEAELRPDEEFECEVAQVNYNVF